MNKPAISRCPITYEPLPAGQKYSAAGLKKLSPLLHTLEDLPLTAEQLRREAAQRALKMSIQGVQPKLSAILKPAQGRFEIIDTGGKYILKPPLELYPEVPENEDVSMRLARTIGIEVPLHGLLYTAEGSLTYFIQRFDRGPRDQKFAMEDFAQLAGETRDTKYDFSMERLVPLLESFCTFPVLEKQKLLQRVLFNFLIGNEDMHLKNYSLISREDKIELSPAYDFLNTTLVTPATEEEIALPLRGKKNKLERADLIDYFAYEKLGLNKPTVEAVLDRFKDQVPQWGSLLRSSFLSLETRESYDALIQSRYARLRY